MARDHIASTPASGPSPWERSAAPPASASADAGADAAGRFAFDEAPLGMCVVDPGGRVLTANHAFRRLVGAGRPALADVVHAADQAAVAAVLRRLAAGDAPRLAMEKRFLRPDGSVFACRLTVGAFEPGPDGDHCAVAVVEDVSERERIDSALEVLTERLESLTRARSALVSGVSHEFRTALTSIEGFSELLRDQEMDASQARELAADVNVEARRLGRLIDDLLDLDRLESGRFQLRIQPVDVGAILGTLADRIRRGSTGHDVVVRVEDPPVIHADADRLTQVFSNLLANAVKYSPPEGPIEVTAVGAGGGVRVEVRDGGPGIPSEALDVVFERHVRLEREARAGLPGSGLGLSIVRQIVAMHGGRVWAANAPGGGALLTVELPPQAPREDHDAPPVL